MSYPYTGQFSTRRFIAADRFIQVRLADYYSGVVRLRPHRQELPKREHLQWHHTRDISSGKAICPACWINLHCLTFAMGNYITRN
jgi:hypothetical protein